MADKIHGYQFPDFSIIRKITTFIQNIMPMNHHNPFLYTFLTVILLFASTMNQAQSTIKSASSGSAVVTSITSQYTYPTAISADGEYVVGMPFGGMSSYFWSAGSGIIQMAGELYGVSNGGTASGTYLNPTILHNGNNVNTAGIWDHITAQWTFLGMNPVVPQTFSTDYNVGWDMTSDGTTVVGMQWLQNYDYIAYKWTQSGGYDMIGTGVGQGSRASGISSNGNVVFGWAELATISRTPVIWYNGQVIYINNGANGEAYGASTTGNYVTGEAGGQGFRWSPQGTILFSNTLNSGAITPTTVLNDGTVMGYTYQVPTSRRAFVRDSLGSMMTFNDYAEARGLTDAQQWTFYSINDVTADGNKFLGAGKTPSGQAITFIIEFTEEIPVFSAFPSSIDFGEVPVGIQSPFRELAISNTGTGNLSLNSLALGGSNSSQFVLQDSHSYPVTLGPGDTATVSVAFAPTSYGLKSATVDITTNAGSHQVPLSGTGKSGVGMEEGKANSFNVFPNPAGGLLNITDPGGIGNVKLFSISGLLLYQGEGNGKSAYTIYLNDIVNGQCILQCITEAGVVHRESVIIQN